MFRRAVSKLNFPTIIIRNSSVDNKLKTMLENDNVQKKLHTYMKNYFATIKYPIGLFTVIGTGFGIAHALDANDTRHLTRKEYILYPVGGMMIGTTIGATWPFWIVGAPLVYFLGSDVASTIVKIILLGGLGGDK